MSAPANFEIDLLAAWTPPTKLSLSEWADRYAYLSAESAAEPGRWHTLPYQKGIMDAFTTPEIEKVTVMKSARVGYTKILNNVIAYHIHQDPCSLMLVQPTIEDAQGYSKEEIAPMIRDTPVLRSLVADPKSKDSDNTILNKIFPGGLLSMGGANSARFFRRVSRRVVLFDEVDGYPPSAGTEGDQIKLGEKRTEAFWNRKIGAGSTPTIKGHSKIEFLFNQSDQRFYHVPCPQCDEKQVLKWGGKNSKFGIQWPDGEPENAYYVCEKNGCIIDHKFKKQMIERGEWIASMPGNGGGRHAGFHIWAAYSYSPNATWGHLAKEFLDSKDDPLKLQTFVNTVLGEGWEEDYSSKIGAEGLAERAENYQQNTVPMGGLLLTAGIDTQDNRVAIAVKAWGKDEESWLIKWVEIYGDPARSEIWDQVEDVLKQKYRHASGADMEIKAAALDTGGHFTHECYIFCRTQQKKGRWVIAIKGSSIAGKPVIGKPTRQDVNYKQQVIKKGVALWFLGTDTIKSVIYGRLKFTEEAGPGVMHFPLGLPEEYFKQLTAEKQITRYSHGFAKKIWIKQTSQRNEALDCEVYAYGALNFYYTKVDRTTIWLRLEKYLSKLEGEDNPDDPDKTPPQNANRAQPRRGARRKGGFVNRW